MISGEFAKLEPPPSLGPPQTLECFYVRPFGCPKITNARNVVHLEIHGQPLTFKNPRPRPARTLEAAQQIRIEFLNGFLGDLSFCPWLFFSPSVSFHLEA